MTRKNEEFAIDKGPSKLDLMLSLFDTEMGARVVRFRVGDIYNTGLHRKADWLEIEIVYARRRDPAASIWEMRGIVRNLKGHEKEIVWASIYYHSDTREGRMRFEEELRTHGIMETPDDAKRARALMSVIERMVVIAQEHGRIHRHLPDEFYKLYNRAKPLIWANDRESLAGAIKDI